CAGCPLARDRGPVGPRHRYSCARASERWCRMTAAPVNSPPPFSTAAALWLQEHNRYIKPNTAKAYNDALKPLCKFLGDKPINEIEIVHVRMYQDLRRNRAGAHAINREVGVLQQI